MSDKRYPTRMHEVLTKPGEPPLQTGERFRVKDLNDEFFVNIHGRMMLVVPSGHLPASGEIVAHAINHGITRHPRLTEEQVKRLRALIALEAMYLAKNKDGSVGAFTRKPQRNALYWNTNDSYVFYLSIVGTCLSELVSWEDPEPLDIVQTLRDAGVEVDDA